MLVLTRRLGETLLIGDDIKLTVVGVKNGQVRLGIDAPKEVNIQREELTLSQENANQPTKELSDCD